MANYFLKLARSRRCNSSFFSIVMYTGIFNYALKCNVCKLLGRIVVLFIFYCKTLTAIEVDYG